MRVTVAESDCVFRPRTSGFMALRKGQCCLYMRPLLLLQLLTKGCSQAFSITAMT
jgi:hypothetical protein